MSETTWRCPDDECEWTLTVPYGPDVEPNGDWQRAEFRKHMIEVHGFQPENFVD